jgi:hypothetical protein
MFSAFQSNGFQSNAFQILTQIAKSIIEGGASGKGGKRKRKSRIYVERDGKIYVFANEYQASAFVEAQKQDQPKKKKSIRQAAKELISEPLEKIDVGNVKELAAKYSKKQQLTDLLTQNDYDEFVYQYRLLLTLDMQAKMAASQEEEEIAILLMAI